jgi:hypothetical protein
MKYSWMSPIIFKAKSTEKMQVFWPWSSLRISAWTVPRTQERTVFLIFRGFGGIRGPAVIGLKLVDALVNGGV